MSVITLKDKLLLPFLVIGLLSASFAHATLFKMTYRTTSGVVAGTGFFGYDQPAQVGRFSLSDLTNITYEGSFTEGQYFTSDDIGVLSPNGGISVFTLESEQLGFVFTGWGIDGRFEGPFDLVNGSGFLSHEPTISIGSRLGCCGGDGTNNLYMLGDSIEGTYSAVSVPEPGTLFLLACGLVGMILMGRKRTT